MARSLPQRRALLTAALGFRHLDIDDPAARALARWLDSWQGLGAVVDGMLRQGFAVDLTGGPEGWSVAFLHDRPVGGAAEIVGSAHESTPWRAAQRAARQALTRPQPGA